MGYLQCAVLSWFRNDAPQFSSPAKALQTTLLLAHSLSLLLRIGGTKGKGRGLR